MNDKIKIIYSTIIVALALIIFFQKVPHISLDKLATFEAHIASPYATVKEMKSKNNSDVSNIAVSSMPEESSSQIDSEPVSSDEEETSEISSEPESESESSEVTYEKIEDNMLDDNVLEKDLSQQGTQQGDLFVKNTNSSHSLDINQVLQNKPSFKIAPPNEPTVLIYHTHTCEAFAGTRSSTDPQKSVVAVAEVIASQLRKNGIGVLHDTTIHDYPEYNGCYDRSRNTALNDIKENPSIQITLDIHRDSMTSKSGVKYKPTTIINGKKAAQIMIISGCNDDGSMDFPNWEENLKFSSLLQNYGLEYPTLMRPLDFCPHCYNEDMTTGSLLCEFGTEVNTLDEACYSGELFGNMLSKLILENSHD